MKIYRTPKQKPADRGMAELKARLTAPGNLMVEERVKKAQKKIHNTILTLGACYVAMNVLILGGLQFNQNYANHARAKDFAASLKVEPPLVAPMLHGKDEKTPVTFKVSVTDSTFEGVRMSDGRKVITSTGAHTHTFNLGLRDWRTEDEARKAIEANGGKVIGVKREKSHAPPYAF